MYLKKMFYDLFQGFQFLSWKEKFSCTVYLICYSLLQLSPVEGEESPVAVLTPEQRQAFTKAVIFSERTLRSRDTFLTFPQEMVKI